MIKLKPEISYRVSDIDELIDMFPKDTKTKFVFDKEVPSILDESKAYLKYKQFHNNIEVLGGGITIQAALHDNDNPCDDVYFLVAPHIYSDIDIDVTTLYSSSQAEAVLNADNTESSELVYMTNYDCNYHLVWKQKFLRDSQKRIAYFDAKTGDILLDRALDSYLTAPTHTYGSRDLDDNLSMNEVCLESDDSPTQVRTFNFGSQNLSLSQLPQTINSSSTYCESGNSWGDNKFLYQAHFATTEALKGFTDLGINFGNVNIAVTTSQQTIGVPVESSVNEAYILASNFSKSDNCDNDSESRKATALIDVIGHELGHSVLNDAFAGIELTGDRSIKEAICDMFGTYSEYLFQGYVDWIIADDEGAIECRVQRNLQNPGFSANGNLFMGCFSEEFAAFNDTHQRSLPLSHWFYLASTSNGLGLKETLRVVIDALPMIPSAGDIPDVRDAVMMVLESQYESCADEIVFTALAWEDICIGLPDYDECIKISGPNFLCEEEDYAQFSIINPVPGGVYRWYFPFGWTVSGSQPNSNIYEGPILTATAFNDENFYSIYKNINVTLLNGNGSGDHQIRLDDCNGDNQGCEDVLGFYEASSNSIYKMQSKTNFPEDNLKVENGYYRIYDLNGILLYEGKNVLEKFENFRQREGLFILSHFDDSGYLLKSEKLIFF